VVCTKEGGEVLTAAVPSTIEEIEALMKKQGILDEID
jgi:hypothetical protein